ncbi:MAG: hypothetical protein GY713_16725 [Actinomycetia bacterium]|nr:hypothetical protein [Actinomycetes bacterium]
MSDLAPICAFEVIGTAPAHSWETGEGAPDRPETYVGELIWVAERLGGGDNEIAQITHNVLSRYIEFEPGG